MKGLLILAGLVPIVVIAIALQRCEPAQVNGMEVQAGSAAVAPALPPRRDDRPAFHVRVDIPRIHRPLFGFPDDVGIRLKKDPELDVTAPGAEAAWIEPDRLELTAENWNLTIVAGVRGEVAPGTFLVYPMEAEGPVIRCRPDRPARGHLRLDPARESGSVGGEFTVELSSCENVASGRRIDWPMKPLTVVGSFDQVPRLRSRP